MHYYMPENFLKLITTLITLFSYVTLFKQSTRVTFQHTKNVTEILGLSTALLAVNQLACIEKLSVFMG
jgi:hypothetical protein